MPVRPEQAIPHRPPFLLLDEIREISPGAIVAATVLRPDDELWSRVYAGHYPGSPITPGVLLLEMMLQAAAALLGETVGAAAEEEKGKGAETKARGMPVATRIQDAKFRRMVFPGDALEIRAELVERLGSAFFMKGRVTKGGKAAAEARFAVAWTTAALDGEQ